MRHHFTCGLTTRENAISYHLVSSGGKDIGLMMCSQYVAAKACVRKAKLSNTHDFVCYVNDPPLGVL